jgi:hypothetical protein
MYPWDLEIPFVLWVCEWSDESTRGGIDVDGYRDPSFGFVLVEFVRHSLDGLENSSVGRSEDTTSQRKYIVNEMVKKMTYTKIPIVFSSTYFMASLGSIT